MLEYVKYRKSLVSKGKKRSSVATPTSAPPSVSPVTDSARPSQVASPVSSIPSFASEEGLKSLMHSVLASLLSQPSSLGSNPFVAAPSAEAPNVSHSGSAGGSQDDNLLRGRPVCSFWYGASAPSRGFNPPPPNPHVYMCVASVSLASGVGVGVGARDSLPSSLGHLSDSFRQDLGHSLVRDAPGFDNNVFPTIRLPEYLISTVLFARQNTSYTHTHTHRWKRVSIPL